MAGSYVVCGAALPKFAFSRGVQKSGANWMFGFVRSQSGMPLPLLSCQTRETDDTVTLGFPGLTAWAMPIESCWTLRLTLALMAILPLPNRSYVAPRRG